MCQRGGAIPPADKTGAEDVVDTTGALLMLLNIELIRLRISNLLIATLRESNGIVLLDAKLPLLANFLFSSEEVTSLSISDGNDNGNNSNGFVASVKYGSIGRFDVVESRSKMAAEVTPPPSTTPSIVDSNSNTNGDAQSLTTSVPSTTSSSSKSLGNCPSQFLVCAYYSTLN